MNGLLDPSVLTRNAVNSVYSFPIAVVTNYHTINGWKQYKFIVL